MRNAEHIRYLILAAQREGNRRFASDLKPLGLTPAQSEVLRILGERSPLTLTELGEMLVCESGTNPSRLVDKLVDHGLVLRVTDESDRRRVTLTLSAAGRSREVEVRAVEDRVYAELEASFPAVDVEGLIAYLHLLVADRPAGLALAARIGAQTS
ncbi:MAG: MarR family transcriptional regulator [Pseudolysinimonas sp.]